MKGKATSIRAIVVAGLLSAAFETLITWKSFDNVTVSLIAAGITFGVVVITIVVLRLIQKDDIAVKPGSPRLK